MKKIIGFVIMAVLVTASFVVAQPAKEDMGEGMMGKGMMDHEMMMMHKGMMGDGMKMRGMSSPSMVASSDGGVFILSGNKLTKYDKNLNVVKEVELPCDSCGMQHKMKGKMGKCPIRNEKVGDDAKKGSADEKSSEEKKEGHESHH